MNILIISAQAIPVPIHNYGGCERLAWELSEELAHQGHVVTLVACEGSTPPAGVSIIHTQRGGGDVEPLSYPKYRDILSQFDIIHDLSHSHCPSMEYPNLPAINIIWHDSYREVFPEPKYNIASISQYGADAFTKVYSQKAIHQETILVNPDLYRPNGSRGDRFIALGKMSVEKGNLEAMRLARKLNVPLDVVGGLMFWDDQSYLNLVKELCDGEQIRYLGDAQDTEKIKLLQTAKALIYPVGQLEIHSHKIVEALMCGCPCITYDWGAMSEVMGSLTGLVQTEDEFLSLMQDTSKLPSPETCRNYALSKWSTQKVAQDYVQLYQKVISGYRW